MAILPLTTDRHTTPTRVERRAELLRALRQIHEDREALRRNEADLIDWARDLGATWNDVGEALRISGKGARQAWLRRTGKL